MLLYFFPCWYFRSLDQPFETCWSGAVPAISQSRFYTFLVQSSNRLVSWTIHSSYFALRYILPISRKVVERQPVISILVSCWILRPIFEFLSCVMRYLQKVNDFQVIEEIKMISSWIGREEWAFPFGKPREFPIVLWFDHYSFSLNCDIHT